MIKPNMAVGGPDEIDNVYIEVQQQINQDPDQAG